MMATQIKVKLVNEDFMGEFYFQKDPVALARQLNKEGRYRVAGEFAVMGTGEAAAEECFDIANNPSREDERRQLYGDFRSISVGDIVNVDGEDYLCQSMGWSLLS